VANATRAAAGKAAFGQPNAALYQQIGAVPTQYAAAFKDVTSGSNGSCSTCTAKTGYDTPTGWGTPNVTTLLTTTSLSGVAGKAFSGSIGYSAPGASSLTITISGAASGMVFSAGSSGINVGWAKPVAGKTTLVITLKDNLGNSSTGNVTVTINAS
jgi:hypothetical protein